MFWLSFDEQFENLLDYLVKNNPKETFKTKDDIDLGIRLIIGSCRTPIIPDGFIITRYMYRPSNAPEIVGIIDKDELGPKLPYKFDKSIIPVY